MCPDWQVAWSRASTICPPVGTSETVFAKIDAWTSAAPCNVSCRCRLIRVGSRETRARVDGRSLDCRRSERRRTADRWWVESESTDLPDSCEPTKRALSSPVLSRSPLAAPQSPARPRRVLSPGCPGRNHDDRTRHVQHPPGTVGGILARTCWTTKRRRADQRLDRPLGRHGPDLHQLYAFTAARLTELGWLN